MYPQVNRHKWQAVMGEYVADLLIEHGKKAKVSDKARLTLMNSTGGTIKFTRFILGLFLACMQDVNHRKRSGLVSGHPPLGPFPLPSVSVGIQSMCLERKISSCCHFQCFQTVLLSEHSLMDALCL